MAKGSVPLVGRGEPPSLFGITPLQDIWAFLTALVLNWATIVYGAFFAIEAGIRFFWKGYDALAARWIYTKQAQLLLAIAAFVIANYLAFHDAKNEARQLRSEKGSARLTFTRTNASDPMQDGKSPGMRLEFANTGTLPSSGLVFKHSYSLSDKTVDDNGSR